MAYAAVMVVDAAQARGLRWWSDAALRAMADRLGEAVQPWAASWGLDVKVTDARNAAGVRPSGGAQQTLCAAGAVILWQEGAPATALARLLFGLPRNQAGRAAGLADDVASQAWSDLQQAIERAAPAVAVGRVDHEACAWSGAVHLDLKVSGSAQAVQINVLLDPACATDWCRAVPSNALMQPDAARSPLVPLQSVVASRPVTLSLRLADVELDLGSLQSLAVGDVLALPHGLDDPLHVVADLDGTETALPWCRAHLAQQRGRLVAELVASAPPR